MRDQSGLFVVVPGAVSYKTSRLLIAFHILYGQVRRCQQRYQQTLRLPLFRIESHDRLQHCREIIIRVARAEGRPAL